MISRPDRRLRSRPGVRRGVALVVVMTLLVVLVAGVALFSTERDLREVQARQQQQIVPASLGVARLLSLMIDQETGYRGFVLTGRDDFLEPYTRGQVAVGPLIEEIRGRTTEVPGMSARLDAVRAAELAWTQGVAESAIAAVREGRREAAVRLVSAGTGKQLFDDLRKSHASAEASLAAYDLETTQEATRLSRRLTFLLAASLALLALLASLTAVTLERSILRPLGRIGSRVRAVSGGDLDQVVESEGPREFRDLARDVDTMRRRMLDEIDSTRHATEALALREPTVVALRAALAPALTSVPGVEIAAKLEPAEGVLAGDFVDSVVLPGGRLGFVLGDVAGHGPAPAIFGLRLKLLFGSLLASGLEPGEVLAAALTRIGDVTEETFATVVVGIVDADKGEIRYANAGHPPPLLLGDTTRGPGRHLDLSSTGPFLSPLFPQATWETRTAPFDRTDLLLVYTDGVIEARSADGKELGLQRTIDTLASQRWDEDLDVVLDVLYGEIRDYAATLKDDTTLMLCRRASIPAAALPDDAPSVRGAAGGTDGVDQLGHPD